MNNARKSNGDANINPHAQISGSEFGYFFRNICPINVPNDTPIIPVTIVMIPNLNVTLQKKCNSSEF